MSPVSSNLEKYARGWGTGLPETPCGSGSTLKATKAQREWLPEVIEGLGIASIVDVGAGDLNWISHVDLRGAQYRPLDLVPRHPSVEHFDLLLEVPPPCDLLMVLWVINHFPYDAAEIAWSNVRAAQWKYLMITDRPAWHHEQPQNSIFEPIDWLVLNEETGDRLLLIEKPVDD